MLRVVVVAGLGVLLAGTVLPVSAAGLESEVLKAHVPFAFEVHGVAMPSGDYVIREGGDLDPSLLEIRSADARQAAFFFVEDAGIAESATGRATIVFDRRGQTRFLHSVRLADGALERLPVSADEIEAARR
jgi:hypothetical protein